MITLHHLKQSQSFRIVWLLEELQYKNYTLKLYDRLPSFLAPDDYKAISPLGTAPVITADQDVNAGTAAGSSVPLCLSESNAIIDYILDLVANENDSAQAAVAARLRPLAGDAHRTAYLFWFHASPGSLQPILNTDTIFRILPTKVIWPICSILRLTHAKVNESYLHPRLTTLLQLAEAQLTRTEYLAGSTFTAADITAIFSFDAIFSRDATMGQTYPACKAWFDRMQKRDAFVAALQKVGQTSIG